MELSSSTTALREARRRLLAQAVDSRWFIFGSTLDNNPTSDLDLLIVYDHEDHQRAARLLATLEQLDLPQPLHIEMLSAKEEAQMDGIAAFQATPI